MSTDVEHNEVAQVALSLMWTNGKTTTLEVKEGLRKMGRTAFQDHISYAMQQWSDALGWIWEFGGTPPHRVYFPNVRAYQTYQDSEQTTEPTFLTDAVAPTLVATKKLKPHYNARGDISLDESVMNVFFSKPLTDHWHLYQHGHGPTKGIYVTDVPIERKFRNHLRYYYQRQYGGRYFDVAANQYSS